MFAAMVPSEDGRVTLDADDRREALLQGLTLLDALQIEDERVQPLRDALAAGPRDESLDALEATYLAIDEAIPSSIFRERLTQVQLDAAVLCPVAALLARHAQLTARLDRVELLATRVLTREIADGQLEALPEEDFLRVLDQIAPAVTLAANRRDPSVSFFIEAAQRLEGFTSAHDVFNSGLYMDVQGYKRGLRSHRLDPGILYASVLLSVAITNHLMRLVARTGAERGVVLARIASTDMKVDEIFSRREQLDLARKREAPQAAPVAAPVQVTRKEKEAAKAKAKATAEAEAEARAKARAEGGLQPPELAAMNSQRGRRYALVAGVILAIVGAGMIVRGPVSNVNTLVAMDGSATARISPLLASAELAKGAGKPTLWGRVHEPAWLSLSLAERKSAAAAMVKSLAHKSIDNAFIFRGKSLVVQVDQGQLILVR